MFEIILHQPRIPQNTGNIGRLCYATKSILHLIYPLGFRLSQKQIKRSGMDYWENLIFYEWEDAKSFYQHNTKFQHFYFSTKAKQPYYNANFKQGGYLHFGREDAGLDEALLAQNKKQSFVVPMQPNARSLNLATTVGIVLYEGLRQASFHL